MVNCLRSLLIVLFTGLVLVGCGGKKLAPVTIINAGSDERGDSHTVRKGETVYAIAWRYGFDYRDLATWNRLQAPYIIYPGQTLALTGPSSVAARAPEPGSITRKPLQQPKARPVGPKPKASPRPAQRPKPKPAVKPKPTPKPKPNQVAKATPPPAKAVINNDRRIDNAKMGSWIWPAKGRLTGTFGKGGGKGINIEGRREQTISAAHGGRVVYAGGG